MTQIRASRRKFHIIYKTTCLVTGRYYIGMHSTDDLEDGYMGSGQVLWKSIKKYGKDQHIYEILEHLPTRESLIVREEELVNPDILKDPLCMNLRTGGTGNYPGFCVKADVGVKISEKLKAHYSSDQGQITKQKLSEALVGKPKSEETRSKISISSKGVKKSDEHRASMSVTRTGRPLSEKQKQNHSNGQAGRCTVDGETIFESKTALAKALGHGRAGARSPNFRYVDEDRFVQSQEQREKARLRMLGKPHHWKPKDKT